MKKGVVIYVVAAVLLGGCTILDKKQVESAPADFIIEQDTTSVVTELNEMLNYDHAIIFKRKQHQISEAEKARLLNWLHTTKPAMVGVRGTGGAERHRELGFMRAAEIISLLQSEQAGVDAILLDYDATLLGGQGLLTVIPSSLEQKIKTQAPILVISSN